MEKMKLQDYLELKKSLGTEILKKTKCLDYSLTSSENVLLYKYNKKIKIGAYVKHKNERFYFPVYKWSKALENVFSFRFYIKKGIHFEPLLDCEVVEKKDLTDFYIVFVRGDVKENIYFLELYHKEKCEFSIRVSKPYYNYGVDLKLIYTTQEANKYTYWIYKNGNHIAIFESDNDEFSKTQYEQTNRSKRENIFDDYIEFIFHYVNCKKFYISEYYARAYGDLFEILPKQFEDDDTYNYRVKFRKNKIDEILFMNYCLGSEIAGYAAYGIPVEKLIEKSFNKKSEYLLYVEIISLWEYLDYENQCIEIIKHICKLKKIENDYYNIVKLKYFDRPWTTISEAFFEYTKKEKSYYEIDFSKYKERYNKIYEELLKDNKNIQIKWKSEYELYKLIKSVYPEAIYQYRANWLGLQSLDVYIPNLRIAFEYQGIQHYKPIKIFGGEEGLRKRMERDRFKSKICKDNNVTLIYWRYDEKINIVTLKEKLLTFVGT